MRKKIILLISLLNVFTISLMAGSSWLSQNMPNNPELRDALSDFLHKTPGSITEEDLLNINDLTLSNKGIQSLEGIEFLYNLEILDLSFNEIKNIAPLTALPFLKSIKLNNNYINLTDSEQLSNINNFVQKSTHIEVGHQTYTPVKDTKHLLGDGSSSFDIVYDSNGRGHLRIGGKSLSEATVAVKEQIRDFSIKEKAKETVNKAKEKLKKWKN